MLNQLFLTYVIMVLIPILIILSVPQVFVELLVYNDYLKATEQPKQALVPGGRMTPAQFAQFNDKLLNCAYSVIKDIKMDSLATMRNNKKQTLLDDASMAKAKRWLRNIDYFLFEIIKDRALYNQLKHEMVLARSLFKLKLRQIDSKLAQMEHLLLKEQKEDSVIRSDGGSELSKQTSKVQEWRCQIKRADSYQIKWVNINCC